MLVSMVSTPAFQADMSRFESVARLYEELTHPPIATRPTATLLTLPVLGSARDVGESDLTVNQVFRLSGFESHHSHHLDVAQ